MRQTQKPRIVNLLMLTVAGMINAFGITLFMTPVKLYDSGISGTSMLLVLIIVIILADSEYSIISCWIKEAGWTFYILCNLHSWNLFFVCMADNKYISN